MRGAVLLTVLLFACTREPESVPPKQTATPSPAPAPVKQTVLTPQETALSGCYRAEWRPANPFPRYFDADLGTPKNFELSTTPVEPGARHFLIKGRGEKHAYWLAGWELVSDQEARLTWSTGFVGVLVSVKLPPENGTLHGDASTFADIPEKPDTAKVKLIRVAC